MLGSIFWNAILLSEIVKKTLLEDLFIDHFYEWTYHVTSLTEGIVAIAETVWIRWDGVWSDAGFCTCHDTTTMKKRWKTQ